MSFFNPKIYNKENLKEDDLSELEYWDNQFKTIIEDCRTEFFNSGSPTFDKMRQEIIDDFCRGMRDLLGYIMQENVVGIIDNYSGEVVEREEYTTFLNKDEEDEEE